VNTAMMSRLDAAPTVTGTSAESGDDGQTAGATVGAVDSPLPADDFEAAAGKDVIIMWASRTAS
jgi:S-adenosylmethionine synthetase